MKTLKRNNCVLVHGDCYSLLSKLITNKAWRNRFAMLFTDPPYNLANVAKGEIKFKGREDLHLRIADWDKEEFSIESMLPMAKAFLREDGNLACFTAYHQFGKYHILLDDEYDTFIPVYWIKNNPPCSIRKTSFRQAVETVVCCWNKKHKFNFKQQKEMLNYVKNPICAGHERLKNAEGKTLHPTQKPIKLLKHFIEVFTNEGDWVLDPFCGVGSIADACLQLNRKCFSIEKDEAYFRAAALRLGF